MSTDTHPATSAGEAATPRSLVANRTVALGGATIATGLIAGLFYGFVCAVMPGLHHSSDRAFIEAMQRINK